MTNSINNDASTSEFQNLLDLASKTLDWPGLESIVKLGLAVLRETKHEGLDPEKMFSVEHLARQWGWNDIRYFTECLEKSGVTLYRTGPRGSRPQVILRDVLTHFGGQKP